MILRYDLSFASYCLVNVPQPPGFAILGFSACLSGVCPVIEESVRLSVGRELVDDIEESQGRKRRLQDELLPRRHGTYLNPNNAATGYFSHTMDEKGT